MSVLRDADALAERAQDLDRLARATLDPNPYFEPWMLLPGLRLLPREPHLEFALVSRRDGTLIGFFPLARTRRLRGLPITLLTLWGHKYCALRTPLVHARFGRECMGAFLTWLRADGGATLIQFEGIRGDGPFRHLLLDVLDDLHEPSCSVDRTTRGLYLPRADVDAYLSSILDGEGKRQLKSKERRLAAAGRLAYDALENGNDIERWTAEFLELEASGWKGRQGTAIGSCPSDREFFGVVVEQAFRRGQLDLQALRLDGRPVAMRCNLRANEGAFVFKIAYDEQYAKYSPGMLLEIEGIRRLHAPGSDVRWVDSCATPRSPHFSRACGDRRCIETVLVPTGSEAGRLLVALVPFAQWGSRLIRRVSVRAGGSVAPSSVETSGRTP